MKKTIYYLTILSLVVSLFGFVLPTNTNAAQKTQKTQKVICIDPGHQKKQNLKKERVAPGSKVYKTKVTSGTAGVSTKKPEYKLNLEVSLKLRDALKKKGYKVYMTRTKHDVNLSNVDRANYCNKKKADLTIRIHADGSTNKNVQGLSVLYPTAKNTKKINATSLKAAKLVLKNTIKTTKAKKAYSNGLMPRSDLTGFNWSTTPVVLVEMGFMSNPKEDKKLSTKSYQTKLVNGMVAGINAYLK